MTDSTGWSAPDPDNRSQLPKYPAQSGHGGYGAGGPGKPGVIPLRPLAVGEILEGAVGTMRRHAGVVFGSSAVIALLSAGLYIIADLWILDATAPPPVIDPNASPEVQLDQALAALGDNLANAGVMGVINLLTQTFLAGLLTVVVGKAVLGRPIGFAQAWEELRPRLLPLFGLTVVVTLLVAVGLVLFIVPGVWLFVLFSLAAPALVLERGSIGDALRRSPVLVRQSWWRVFGVLLLAMLIGFLISFVIQLPFGLLAGDPTATAGLTVNDVLILELGNAVAQTIVVPFASAVTALLYIDQRMCKERLDEELARSAGGGA
ncbi:Uncharacterized protein family (UPF0259) [Saccharomonospora marina XMU15]|uniref:Uncharacterized protein family (UPF0259) n=1 Tax=Saccharomonospora marina XMU15 TaxID=882083 RepID=H5XAD2_9PSEU|nr:YciC family protein [Saccharomonospora marina]EHR49297.1 Uncharacterized protein family (UPF0259) [Saccharomonospora marina XMU15]